jgi:hypothetical protein
MRKLLILGCVVAASFICPTVVGASTLTYTGLGSGAWVTLNLGGVTETGWAGEIKWTLDSGGVSTAITTFCADLFDDAKNVQQGNLTTTAALDSNPSISHGTVPNAGSIGAYLVNTYAAGAHGSNIQSAGLQLAIWRSMFGNTFLILSSTPNYNEILAAAAGFTVPGGVSSVAGYFDVVNGTGIGSAANGQDQVLVGTPEPATILLVMFAFLGTFGYHYRLKLRVVRAR